MKRVYIVVEGQTEQEFVNSVISPYLQEFGILSVTPVLVRTSRTGRGRNGELLTSGKHDQASFDVRKKRLYRNYLY